MHKMRNGLLAVLAALISLFMVATVTPNPAAAGDGQTITINGKVYKKSDVGAETYFVHWHHNPGGSNPDHWVEASGNVYYYKPTGQPLSVDYGKLECGPTGGGVWGSGTNVNGNDWSWGGYKLTTNDFNLQWAAPYGGNIAACGSSSATDIYPSGQISSSDHTVRIRYEFTTNYGAGTGSNDHVRFIITYPWGGAGYTGGGGGGGTSSRCTVEKDYGLGTFIPTTAGGLSFDCWGYDLGI